MITKEQALTANEFHYTGRQDCKADVGPKGGIKLNYVRARRNGQTQTWKRDAVRFRVPVKHGLYEYGEITESNAAEWHVDGDCPLREQGYSI